MRPRLANALFFSVIVGVATIAACHSSSTSSAQDDASALADAQVVNADDTKIIDAGPGNKTKIAAANFQVSVIDVPAWPESKTGAKRLGYLRAGAIVSAYDRAIVNDECKDGWYALEQGGYVCGKYATFDFKDPRVKLAPRQPDTKLGMPYRYAMNLTSDTPLYRRVLNVEDRKKYESWLIPKKEDDSRDDEKPEKTEKTEHPEKIDKDDADRLIASGNAGSTAGGTTASGAAPENDEAENAAAATSQSNKDTSAGGKKSNAKDSLKDSGADKPDAGKPKLKELRGRGVLVRRMVRGFYVAVDRDFKAAGARWWRTTYGFAAPFDRMMLNPGATKYHGAWFEGALANTNFTTDGGAPPLLMNGSNAALLDASDLDSSLNAIEAITPFDGGAVDMSLANAVGFVNNGATHKIEIGENDKMGWGAELPKRSAVMLTGRTKKISGVTYHETSFGYFVTLSSLLLAKPQIPPDLAPNEKWIDVDLTRQALVAFEGTQPVFGALVSTGRRNPADKEKDFPTPAGTFHIREKHVTTTMDGDVASDGPYSIEDVPWVMYFEGSYALHGAFWHDSFGNKRSHGCVNMAPDDARTLFDWSLPALPAGWHGAFADDLHPGSRIVIHEDAVAKH